MSHPSLLKQHAIEIWQAGVAAVDSQQLVCEFVNVTSNHLCFGETRIAHQDYDRLVVLGGGKASGWMAKGLEEILKKNLPVEKQLLGRVNAPDDQVAPTEHIEIVPCRPAGINLPTERVLESTDRIIELAAGCWPNDLCLYLISGGGSALLERPVPPITLDEFRRVTQILSHRGASINELNAVRQQISQVKLGGLARMAGCRRMITLIVSDVIGDPIDVIASGPTVDSSTNGSESTRKQLAMNILQRFDPDREHVPESVIQVLQSGETFGWTTTHTEVEHYVIGNNELAVAAAKSKATELGYDCEAETDGSSETAEQVANSLVDRLSRLQPKGDSGRCLISGGEPTVELCDHPGQGGRNQQLVLAAMQILSSRSPDRDYCLLSGGTDGEDGNVPVAGAVFDRAKIESLTDADRQQMARHLASNDSYPLLKEWGCLLETPPTRTNVCDLRIGLKG